MRTALIETLLDLARADRRVFLVTADLGWGVVEKFADAFPDRFLNVGVAEQNMMGVATGLAQAGYVPFVYSIATFSSMRGYEQLRDGPVLHALPVRVVGIGGGFAYGHAGPTHYALEDLVITRAQPGLTVLAPADRAQTASVVRATANIPGPCYLRIGKGNNPPVPGLEGRFGLGRPELVRRGADLLFLATGSLTPEVVGAAERLGREGVSAAVAVQAHLPYAPTPELVELLAGYSAVVTAEEGYTSGGLGALVAEAVAGNDLGCQVAVRGVRAPFTGVSGGEEYMRSQCGLDAASLAESARRLLAARRKVRRASA